jgi:transposase
LIRSRIVGSISREHLRRVLGSMGITAQRTRTWKWSNDPLYEPKKNWVLAAYQAAEAGTLDGVVVSFDECGPISLRPHAGRGWFRTGRPDRQRATYNRRHGTRKLLGAYDVGADRFWGRLEARSVTAKVVLEFLKDVRRRYPAETTVYIVMDNLSAHWTPAIRRWAIESNVGLLPTPTNASHLNRIECHFWAFVEFVINGSDYASWAEYSKASQAYIRRRNRDHHDPRITELENRRKVA